MGSWGCPWMPLAIPVVRPRLFLDRSGSVSSTNDVDADGAALLLAGERRPLMAGQKASGGGVSATAGERASLAAIHAQHCSRPCPGRF
jgi:hypothetical protein